MSADAPARPSIRYELAAPKVARIWLDRAETRNAQDTRLLYELNDAFDRAARDDDVSVIVLAAEGPHFSSGHDLRERGGLEAMGEHETVGTWCGFGCAGAEAQMAREKEIYLGFSERWRNIPKPTIAAVQGKVIAGGLMLVWPCDIPIPLPHDHIMPERIEAHTVHRSTSHGAPALSRRIWQCRRLSRRQS